MDDSKILEASEVNGVRFPEGVKIDVHADDAKKLLESKKAELISMKIEDAINDKLMIMLKSLIKPRKCQ